MATGTYAPDPDLHIVDANGVPVPGGLIWTYIAGTLTPTPTYTDVGLLVPNTNPIVAGSDGRFVAFLAGGISYKFVYETPAVPPAHGATLATRDNILAVTTIAAGSGGSVTQGTFLTGTVNDLALIPGCSVLYCGNAVGSPLTITGLSGGVNGQRLTIIAQGGLVQLAHQSASSLAGNRLANYIGSALTPLSTYATFGYASATYIYMGSTWVMVGHDQGEWLVPPFNAADFTGDAGMTWTVDPGDVVSHVYRVSGKALQWLFSIASSSVSGGQSQLRVTIPGGFRCGSPNYNIAVCELTENGVQEPGECYAIGNTTQLYVRLATSAPLTATTNNTSVHVAITLPVQ